VPVTHRVETILLSVNFQGILPKGDLGQARAERAGEGIKDGGMGVFGGAVAIGTSSGGGEF